MKRCMPCKRQTFTRHTVNVKGEIVYENKEIL